MAHQTQDLPPSTGSGDRTGNVLPIRYQDPLDALWTAAARQLGGLASTAVPRAGEAPPSAPSLFRGMCLRLCESAKGHGDPALDAHRLEAACDRLQAALADRFGLREFLTTHPDAPHGASLPADPLRDGDDPAIPAAQRAWLLSRQSPWKDVLDGVLEATAELATALRPFPLEEDSLWRAARPVHPLRFGPGEGTHACGSCSWYLPGKRTGQCAHARLEGRRDRIPATTPACNRFELPVTEDACGACGACCHRGFSLVPVHPGDAFRTAHPQWVVRDSWGLHVPRPDGRCLALEGEGSEAMPWRCRDYGRRPRHCRGFEAGSVQCLEARRRAAVGP